MPVSMRRWRSCSAAVPPPALPVDAASGLPGEWDEFVSRELGAALALSAGDAEEVLAVAAALEVSLPGTRAAFRSGVLTRDKALIIAGATMLLDPAEARAAEAMVLDRAGSLTRGGVAVGDQPGGDAGEPGEGEASGGRIRRSRRGWQRWAEPSGNAGLTGRELPPAEVLALISGSPGGPGSCGKAGLDGGMDLLRARAFLDILLGIDSRPLGTRTSATPAMTPSHPRTTAPAHASGRQARPGR